MLRRPELAAEIASPGSEIGVHCQRRRLQARLGPRQLLDDMRPRRAWLPVHWSRDIKDWRADATPDSILRRAVRRSRSEGWPQRSSVTEPDDALDEATGARVQRGDRESLDVELGVGTRSSPEARLELRE